MHQKQGNKKYHPILETVFNQLMNFNRMHDYMTDLAQKYKTYRMIGSFRSEVYTSDPANVEYMLNTNFENYGKQWFHIKGLNNDPVIQSYIEEMFYENYKHFKGRLSAHYRKMVEAGKNPRTSIPFDWIPLEKWHAMCDHFDDPKFKKRSEINSKNRKCMPYPHTSGSKSFISRYLEMDQQSFVDYFGDTHISNGEYVNDKAAQKHDEMKSRRSQAIEEENQLSEREIMRETLGVRSGYERGIGSGVVPCKGNKRVRCEASQLKTVQEKLSTTENELQDAISLIKSQQETIQNNDEQRQKQDAEIASLKEGQKELKQLLMTLCAQKLS